MKKHLLSMAFLAGGIVMAGATDYVLFDGNGSTLGFQGDAKGWSAEVTVNGKNFKIETVKDASTTNLVVPAQEIRVYKSSKIIISSSDVTMKQITLTASGSKYNNVMTPTDGWTTTTNALVSTVTNDNGASSVTFSAAAGQFRIKKLVVSDEVPKVEVPEAVSVKSVKETISKDSETSVKVDYPLTVGFVNKGNVFCCDAAGDFIQIYGSNTYKVGDVIPAGWDAKYKLYNKNTPELVPSSSLPAATAGTFSPKTVAAADITNDLVNNVVLVKNVMFDEATPATKSNFTGTCNGTTLSFRNNYELASVAAGTYDLTIVVTIFNDAPSLYVINYTPNTSGIETIEATSKSNVEFYNLNGFKVTNPAHGIYIRVADGKASKIIR